MIGQALLTRVLRNLVSLFLFFSAVALAGVVYTAHRDGVALTDPAVIDNVVRGLEMSGYTAFICAALACLPKDDVTAPKGQIVRHALVTGLHTFVVLAVILLISVALGLMLKIPANDPGLPGFALLAAGGSAALSVFTAVMTLIQGLLRKKT